MLAKFSGFSATLREELMSTAAPKSAAPIRTAWIRVNSMAPGAIRTPINSAAWKTKEAYDALMRLVPYSRIGETR